MNTSTKNEFAPIFLLFLSILFQIWLPSCSVINYALNASTSISPVVICSKENSSTYGLTSLRLLLPNIPLCFFAKKIEAASPLPIILLLSWFLVKSLYNAYYSVPMSMLTISAEPLATNWSILDFKWGIVGILISSYTSCGITILPE